MNRVEELIQQLCPNGVEWKNLGEVCERYNGTQITAGKMMEINHPNGNIRIFAGGKTVVNAKLEDIPNPNIINKPSVLVQSRGVIDFIFYEKPFTFKNELWAYSSDNKITTKFLYYILKNNVEYFRELAKGMGALPQISIKVTEKFKIPVPPLPIQQEIVRILDTFTELTANLQTELDARKKQYAYYRDCLLNFEGVDGVEWKKLGEIGLFYGGLSGKTKKDFEEGNAKYVTYSNIFNNIAVNLNINDVVNILPGEKQNVIAYGDVIFTGSSETPDECGMSSVVTEIINEPIYLNSFRFGFRLNNLSLYEPGFLKFLFRSNNIRNEIKKTANGVTRYNISKKLFSQIEIPIPPLPEQRRIVAILDHFETLVNDLSVGLPAELEARRKQYEYYRDKLLTFDRV